MASLVLTPLSPYSIQAEVTGLSGAYAYTRQAAWFLDGVIEDRITIPVGDTSTEIIFTNLEPDTRYRITVYIYGNNGVELASFDGYERTEPEPEPPAEDAWDITLVDCTPTTATVRIYSLDYATRYKIAYRPSSTTVAKNIYREFAGDEEITGLTPGTEYVISYQGINDNAPSGSQSGGWATLTVRLPACEAASDIIVDGVTSTTVTVIIEPIEYATKYNIVYTIPPSTEGTSIEFKFDITSSTKVTIPGLIPNTRYRINYQGINENAPSGFQGGPFGTAAEFTTTYIPAATKLFVEKVTPISDTTVTVSIGFELLGSTTKIPSYQISWSSSYGSYSTTVGSDGTAVLNGFRPNVTYKINYAGISSSGEAGEKMPNDVEFYTLPQWVWEQRNYYDDKSATTTQTTKAHMAITERGLLMDFSHLVWNDMCRKVKEAIDNSPASLSWKNTYANYDNTCMTNTEQGRIMTAVRFNSLWTNIDQLYEFSRSNGLNKVNTKDLVRGSYFTDLMDTANLGIAEHLYG